MAPHPTFPPNKKTQIAPKAEDEEPDADVDLDSSLRGDDLPQ